LLDTLIVLVNTSDDEEVELAAVKLMATYYREGTQGSFYHLTVKDKYRDSVTLKVNFTNFAHILKQTQTQDEKPPSGIMHQMQLVHFSRPTFCSFCRDFIW
jgi:hypothetical protein